MERVKMTCHEAAAALSGMHRSRGCEGGMGEGGVAPHARRLPRTSIV